MELRRKQKNQQWLWLGMDAKTRQILAFQVGDRTKQIGETLMAKIPQEIKKTLFYTDFFSTYNETIPWKQHRPVGKESGKTNHIKRFNCTMRQRCARLIRKTLSFSKKLENHIGLIKLFICVYKLTLKASSLPVQDYPKFKLFGIMRKIIMNTS